MPREIRAPSSVSETAGMTQAMARGDDAAFARFFEIYFNRLLRYLLAISRGNEAGARDALQDTMTHVARHVRRFDDEQALWDWLAVLARSAARDAGRKQTRYRRLLARFVERNGGRSAFGRDVDPSEERMNAALSAALGALPPLERRLIEQKYFHRASVRELAQARDLTEKAVESRLLRARRVLRAEMHKHLRDEK